jgi:hypothetical protein
MSFAVVRGVQGALPRQYNKPMGSCVAREHRPLPSFSAKGKVDMTNKAPAPNQNAGGLRGKDSEAGHFE